MSSSVDDTQVTPRPDGFSGWLSDDLLWMIFELIHHTDPTSIQSLTQVCRRARSVALEIQYREVVLLPKHLGSEKPEIIGAGEEVTGWLWTVETQTHNEPTQTIVDSPSSENGIKKAAQDQECRVFILERIYETTRHISFKYKVDWTSAAELLMRCKRLRKISWVSSYQLAGAIPGSILNFIAAKSPSIELHISGSNWYPGNNLEQIPEGNDLGCAIAPGCLKSLEYSGYQYEKFLSVGGFSGLESLHLYKCDLRHVISALQPDPFPKLKRLKMTLWNLPSPDIAKHCLSQLLGLIRPLEHLDVMSPGRYLGFTMPAKHAGLRILKLGINTARLYTYDTLQHHEFWKTGIKAIPETCPVISELSLDMFSRRKKINRCVRRLSCFRNLRSLFLRLQTQLITSESVIMPSHDIDLHFVSELVDDIVANTHSEQLQSISIEVGDFRRERPEDRRALWNKMLAEGYERRRQFEFRRVEKGLFAIQKS